jgi:Ca-activated chloride channel family protein
MCNPKPTADDHRDRLVDRVLAEALGDERPPDLSQAIAQRVADAQAEVASTTQGRGVMQSRRVLVTLLATAASLMAVAFVWQADDRHEAMEVATTANERAAEVRFQSMRVKGSELGQSVDALEEEYNSTASLAKDVSGGVVAVPATPALKPGQTQAYSVSPKEEVQLRMLQESANRQNRAPTHREQEQWEMFYDTESSATPTVQPPATVPAPAPMVSDLATITDGKSLPFRQGSFNEPQVEFRSRFGVPISGTTINDATVPPNGPYGFAGGGEWPSQRYRHEPPTSHDRYEPIHENAFVKPIGEDALSTFSIDVDTASYANVRQYLRDMRQMPPADAVRIEELVNYFDYGYEAPKPDSEDPFAANLGCSACPWKPEHKLVRIGVKGREVAVDKRPLSNLVFLIDVSGSMNEENKLPLVVSGLQALMNKLGENDRVAIVVYAGSEGLVLPSTGGDQKEAIRAALDRLTAGGSTAGGAGLRLAYEIAEKNKIVGGVNRVVLCTDGDFNVGMTGTEEIAQFVETRAKETNVYLTVLGFGRGNLNDAMLEQISGRGDGNYAYIDDFKEAHRVLSSDLSKTLVAIAKDVKMQVEFNPAKVASYRLIGYENRVMAAEDFNNDAKDAGDIGAGHTVTALYEVVPVGVEEPAPAVDGLKYQTVDAVEDEAKRVELTASRQGAAVGDDAAHVEPTAFADELLTLKIRYKQPEGGASKKLEFPLEDSDSGKSVADTDADFRWAAAVAEFGMLLRNSRHVGDGSFDAVLELARGAIGDDPQGYRAEFVDLVRRAKEVSGR